MLLLCCCYATTLYANTLSFVQASSILLISDKEGRRAQVNIFCSQLISVQCGTKPITIEQFESTVSKWRQANRPEVRMTILNDEVKLQYKNRQQVSKLL